MKDKLPNFLVVGAAKSGTSSLHEYLVQHEDIFMPTINKEGKSVKEDSKYVKYEGKGLKINMKEVNKDIKKNECKKVAEMLPANDRLKYLRECGYFD